MFCKTRLCRRLVVAFIYRIFICLPTQVRLQNVFCRAFLCDKSADGGAACRSAISCTAALPGPNRSDVFQNATIAALKNGIQYCTLHSSWLRSRLFIAQTSDWHILPLICPAKLSLERSGLCGSSFDGCAARESQQASSDALQPSSRNCLRKMLSQRRYDESGRPFLLPPIATSNARGCRAESPLQSHRNSRRLSERDPRLLRVSGFRQAVPGLVATLRLAV